MPKRLSENIEKIQKSITEWFGHVHDYYKMKIEVFDCLVCWYCGKVILESEKE